MDGQAKATTAMMVRMGNNNEDDLRADVTTTRMVGAGNGDKEDGGEVSNKADGGDEED